MGVHLDGFLHIVQCRARAHRLGRIARPKRSASRSRFHWCGIAASRRRPGGVCFRLRLFLVLVEPAVLTMTHGYAIALLAMDPLQMAVAQDLSSRYCPHSKSVFLLRCFVLFAAFVAVAVSLFFIAYRSHKRPGARAALIVAAGAVLLFAIGAGALVLYGLSGCSGGAAEGLIWDWP